MGDGGQGVPPYLMMAAVDLVLIVVIGMGIFHVPFAGNVGVLVRSAVSNEKATTMLREFLTSELLRVIGRPTGYPDGQLRASLVAAQLIGIAALRHVIRLEPLVKASTAQIVALVTPAVEQYLR